MPSLATNPPVAPLHNQSGADRQVNSLLHALRGEQFRHARNQANLGSHLSPVSRGPSHTLPPLATPEVFSSSPHTSSLSGGTPKRTVAGPAAPRSWTRRDDQAQEVLNGAFFRAQAFELVFRHATAPVPASALVTPADEVVPPPTLLHLSLMVLSEVAPDALAELPSHLRRHLMLHTAVHDPMSGDELRRLIENGGAAGEVVLGKAYAPAWLVRAGVLRSRSNSASRTAPADGVLPAPGGQPSHTEDEAWDASDDEWASSSVNDDAMPLHTLALLSHPLQQAQLITLPPSLTRLALLAQPQPIALHRLPALLPQLILFDVSFNTWLGVPYAEATTMLLGDDEGPGLGEDTRVKSSAIERVGWSRWRKLRVVGLRESGLDPGLTARIREQVQRGRMDDVRVYT